MKMNKEHCTHGREKTVGQIEVIRTFLERRGNGTKDNPIRIVEQFWCLCGQLLAEVDPE